MRLRALLVLLAAIVAAPGLAALPAHAEEQVDLLLVLAADVSRSIDTPKFQLQREGYACLLYTSPSPRDRQKSRMPSSA